MSISKCRKHMLSGVAGGVFAALMLACVPGSASADVPVVANGDYAIGINSINPNGDNVTTGGTTTVSGYFSRGINTGAVNGSNETNTGVVSASGQWARAVVARTYSGTSCGQNVVNVSGDVTSSYHGIVAFGCGQSTVNVGAGNTVASTGSADGGIAIINIGTDVTTNISGTVSASSSDLRALEARSASSATTISATGSLVGTFGGTDGPDSFTINSGGAWSTAGTSDFGGGPDSVTNAGTIAAGTDTTFANLAVLRNSGTLSLAAGTFSIPQAAEFTNSGTIALLGGSTAISSPAPLVNDGRINLQNGNDSDVLTITNGFTATANSVLLVDASVTSNDQLIILGAVSGVTQIFVTGTGALTTTASQIVTANSADPGAFVIAANPSNSLVSYGLKQSGGDFYLYAAPSAVALQPIAVANVSQDMWHQSADIYSAYIGSRGTDIGARANGLGVWGQLYASSDRYGDRGTQTVFGGPVTVDNRVHTHRQGIQVGVDFLPAQGQFLFGVVGGYQTARAGPQASIGSIRAKGYNVGAYARFGGDSGFYAGVLAKGDWNHVRLASSAFDAASGNPNSRSIGVEGEAGLRWGSDSATFDVGGQLDYVRTTIDGFSAQGVAYDFAHANSLRGRVAAQVSFGSHIAPFVGGKLFHEFEGQSRLRLTSGGEFDHVDSRGRGTWARLEAGVGAQRGAGPLVAAWGEFGDVKGLGVRAGYRF